LSWDTDRWLFALEAQFQLTRVKSDVSKFYECLKAALIKKLSDSDSKRVEKLLEAQDLEDKKPSQLLRDMRKLAGSAISDDSFTTMWKSRLPVNMRAILSAADVKDVDKLIDSGPHPRSNG
jgi:hypothetical protein